MSISSRLLSGIIGILALSSTSIAQNVVTVSPPKPEFGDTLTISYYSDAPGAKLQDPENLKLVFGYSTFYQKPDSLEMQKHGKKWTISWVVPDYAKFSCFYFKSDTTVDKGPGGHYYETMIYNNNDQPVDGAYSRKRFSLHDRYKNKHLRDSLILGIYQKQLERDPDDWLMQLRILKKKMDIDHSREESIRRRVDNMINKKYREGPDSVVILDKVISAYSIMGEKSKADSLRNALIKNHPESQDAIRRLYSKARDMDHSPKKLEALEKVAQKTDTKLTRSNCYEMLFDYYREENNVQKMAVYAHKASMSEWPWKAKQYNNLAKGFAEQGDSLELAQSYVKKAMEAIPDENVGPVYVIDDRFIGGYVTDSVATKRRNKIKSSILATYGLIFMNKSEPDKAEDYLNQAMEISDSQAAQRQLAKLYMRTDRPKKAFDTYKALLMKDPTDEAMHKKLNEAYIAFNGSEEGYAAQTKQIDAAWREKMIKRFNSGRIDKEAPALDSITDLKGKPINTDKLKGKIIILDFWATWCGPCMSAFPHMQKIYDQFKDNQEVKFIILNSGWDNTIKEARKWKQKKEYTFPIYYDEDSKVTQAFGVHGIPTTFFIDQNGKIQFKKVGFEGKKMEPKMKLQIELLLGNKGNNNTSPK